MMVKKISNFHYKCKILMKFKTRSSKYLSITKQMKINYLKKVFTIIFINKMIKMYKQKVQKGGRPPLLIILKMYSK